MSLKKSRSRYPVPKPKVPITYRMNFSNNNLSNTEKSGVEKYFGSQLLKLPPSSTGVYRKPLYYGLIHVLSGFLAFHYAWFGIVFLVYQLFQLILNKRFFVFQGRMEEGNSLGHTAFKLGEFLVGMLIAFVIHKIFPKFNLPKDRFSE